MAVDTESLTTGYLNMSNDSNLESGNESAPLPPSVVPTHREEGAMRDSPQPQSPKQITEFDAIQHLIKGNLGPGCLNIPHAFATSGWVLGLFLFGLVAIQGIYSMVLLVYCKQWLRTHSAQQRRMHQDEQQLANTNSTSYGSTPSPETETREIRTFMDVAHATHGRPGAIAVQLLLFVMQGGVCCVFLSLIATNLHAATSWDSQWCVGLVTGCLLLVVLVQDLKELKWLSLGANCLMVVAVGTAAASALWVLWKDSNDDDNNEQPVARKWTTNPAAIAAFVSSMFYSFEGIGLVMPVETSFVGYPPRSGGAPRDEPPASDNEGEGEDELRKAQRVQTFVFPVLLTAMGTVALLFLLIGSTCGVAFPDIVDGSVTAYLTTKFPDSRWYRVVNGSVMVAVFLTFPLQLTPAMEVLEEWFGPGCEPLCCGGSEAASNRSCCVRGGGGLLRRRAPSGGRHTIITEQPPNGAGGEASDVFRDEPEEPNADAPLPVTTHINSCFGVYEWIFRRYLVVFGCAVVVLTVNDLGLLMSLFGALGNTGLAAMPCLIHWRLMSRGIAPLNFLMMAMDALTIGMSLGVAVIGVAFSVTEILEEA